MLAEPGHEQMAAEVASVLFESGQTTEGVRLAVRRLGQVQEIPFRLVATWGELTVVSPRHPGGVRAFAVPLTVDIGRVVAVEAVVDAVEGRTMPVEALARLAAIQTLPPVSLERFAIMAGLGAAALSVIFGVADGFSLVMIFASACLGAWLRRMVSKVSGSPFLQPFAAAALAGALAGGCGALGLPVDHRLVAVCPCMVLVPGPHLLNGAIDLVRAHVPLGAARLALAGLIVLAICAGLLSGLWMWQEGLGAAGSTPPVPFTVDVAAASVAVAAYGSFFNMPWRMLPIPILAGSLGHVVRWLVLSAGFSVPTSAFAACMLVGTVISPLAHWLRLPFGATAFAAVVSMMPGIFLFHAAAEALALVQARHGDTAVHLLGLAESGVTAFLVIMAMTTGLILPKLVTDQIASRRGR